MPCTGSWPSARCCPENSRCCARSPPPRPRTCATPPTAPTEPPCPGGRRWRGRRGMGDDGCPASAEEPDDLHHRQVPRPARARRRLARDHCRVHYGGARRVWLPVVRLVEKPDGPGGVRAGRGVPRRPGRRGARPVGPFQGRAAVAATPPRRDAESHQRDGPGGRLVPSRRDGGARGPLNRTNGACGVLGGKIVYIHIIFAHTKEQ